MCSVEVCACVYCFVWQALFIIAVHLGNKVIFYQLSLLTLQVTVNSRNATQTILSLPVPETSIDSKNKPLKYRNTTEGGARTVTPGVAGKRFRHLATVNRQ